tara:strand:+ start:146 stop:436 length:291 start_codon:yes stop_codon:yes gene_type:complete
MVFEASNEQKSFSIDSLRWKDKYYKLPQYDACYYTVKNPAFIYELGAKIKVKITEMRNVDIYLFGGQNHTTANQKVARTDSDNRILDLNVDFEIDA